MTIEEPSQRSIESPHWMKGTYPLPENAEALLGNCVARLDTFLTELRVIEAGEPGDEKFQEAERIVRDAQGELRSLMFNWIGANPLADDIFHEVQSNEIYLVVSPRMLSESETSRMPVPMELWHTTRDYNIEDLFDLTPDFGDDESTLSDWLFAAIHDLRDLKERIGIARSGRESQDVGKSTRFERDDKYETFWIDGKELHASSDQTLFIRFLDSILPYEASWHTIEGRAGKFSSDKPSKMFSDSVNSAGPELLKLIRRTGSSANTRYSLKLRPSLRQSGI